MHHRAGSRRPKGFGLFDTGAAPTQCATPNFMPVLDDSPRPEWLGSVEVENAMKERHLEFRKNGAARVEVGRGAFAKAYLVWLFLLVAKRIHFVHTTGRRHTRQEARVCDKRGGPVDAEGRPEEEGVLSFTVTKHLVSLPTSFSYHRLLFAHTQAGLEVTFLKSLNHFNVIRCCDAFKTANILHIVYGGNQRHERGVAPLLHPTSPTTPNPAPQLGVCRRRHSYARHRCEKG